MASTNNLTLLYNQLGTYSKGFIFVIFDEIDRSD